MSNSNLLRRRLMGEMSKVSDPVITPDSGPYDMLSNSIFQVTVSCPTEDSTIHWTVFDEYYRIVQVDGQEATGTLYSQGQTPSGTIPKRFVSCGIGESRHVQAYATRDHWITSNTVEKHYYSGNKPPKPSIHIYGSTDSYGNYIDTDFGSSGAKCYTPVHSKIFDFVDPADTSYVTYYTTDGSDPDPSNAGGNNPTKIYDKNVDMVKFTNTGDTFEYYDGIVFDYDYYITDRNIYTSNQYVTITIKAVTVKNGVSSDIGSTSAAVMQSAIKKRIVVNTDEFYSAGKYKNLPKYYGDYIQWNWNIADSTIDINPLNIPDTYGYAVFAYDGLDDFSNSKTVIVGHDSDYMYRWHPISEAPGTTRIELRKFGCPPETVDISTRINKFVMHYVVTQDDITQEKKIFIGRKNYTVNGDTSNSHKFMRMYGSPNFFDGDSQLNQTYEMETGGELWDYDKPDTTPSDYTPNNRYKAWVYVGNSSYQYTRLTTQNMVEDTAVVYATKSDLTQVPHNNNPGSIDRKYQRRSTTGTDSTQYYEGIYLYSPPSAGEYDIVYGYTEQDDYPNPFAFVNSPFSSVQNYQVGICPLRVAVTGGMTSIPKFFLSYISNWNSECGIELQLYENDFSGFLSGTHMDYDGSKTVTKIGDFAFSNIKVVEREVSVPTNPPTYDILRSSIDLSDYKKIDTIGDFVFFNCLSARWYQSTSSTSNSIESVVLPDSLTEVGRFLCGFNVMSSVSQENYPCVEHVTFNSIVPPRLRTAPDTERIDGDNYSSNSDILTVWLWNTYKTGPNYSKPRKWHYMPFGCFVWSNSSSSIGNLSGVKYGWYDCGVRVVKVPDAYVCEYAEKWCYQYSTTNFYDWGYKREKVLNDILPIGIVSAETCFEGHDGSDAPSGSSGKLFTYKEREYYGEYNEQGVLQGFLTPLPNKMCIAAGNLTYNGSSSRWYINDNPWGSVSDSVNEGTSSTATRDKFAWATSGNSHGSVSYHPYEHSTDSDFKNYFAYGLSLCGMRGYYRGNLYVDQSSNWYNSGWLPSSNVTGLYEPGEYSTNSYVVKDKSFGSNDSTDRTDSSSYYSSTWIGSIQYMPTYPYSNSADWGSNKIYSGSSSSSYKENWWYTPESPWLEYVLDDRWTRDGYRFVKAKVNSKYGLILFPDCWKASDYTGLSNVNSKDSRYSSNDISESAWNTSFGPKGCVFLPATGRVTGSSTDYSDRGYYWTSDIHTSKGYCKALYFNGSILSGQGSVSVDNFYRNKALNVRLVRPEMDYSELVDAIETVTSTYSVTIVRSPVSGGVVTGGGTYRYGDECTLRAFPNTGYRFVRWSEGNTQLSTSSILEIEVTSNRTITAVFEQIQYQVVLGKDPENAGTVTGAGAYTYGQTCTVSATASSGYNFMRWEENGVMVSLSSTFNFVVKGDRKLDAIFGVNTFYQITVTCDTTQGSVSGSGSYLYGSNCTATATPSTGYRFDCWMNGNVEVFDSSPYTFVVRESATITGMFKPIQYTVTANSSAGGTASGGGVFNYGATCTLTATPDSGYQFDGWSDGSQVVSTRLVYQFTVTETVELKAMFSEAGPQTVTVRLTPSAYAVSSTDYLSVTNPSNAYTNTDSTTYATVTNTYASTASRYYYLRGFDFNSIPSNATIDSFTVKIKGYESRLNISSSYAPRLANGTSVISNTTASTNFGTSSKTITIPTGALTWQQITNYGSNFTIVAYVRRSTTSNTGYLYCQGAEIEVTYTV